MDTALIQKPSLLPFQIGTQRRPTAQKITPRDTVVLNTDIFHLKELTSGAYPRGGAFGACAPP